MANSSLMNPNQRGLWGSGAKQMDAWDLSMSYPHPSSHSILNVSGEFEKFQAKSSCYKK